MNEPLVGPWVCAVHGTRVYTAVQRGIGGWPIGLCYDCRSGGPMPPGPGATEHAKKAYSDKELKGKIRSKLSPLVRPDEYKPPTKREKEPEPDLSPWAALAPVEDKKGHAA